MSGIELTTMVCYKGFYWDLANNNGDSMGFENEISSCNSTVCYGKLMTIVHLV
jgi:hypothetical protein